MRTPPHLLFIARHSGWLPRARTVSSSAFNPSEIRALSFDVTGTVLIHSEPVMKTYADAGTWARLPDPPSEAELKPAFKTAWKEGLHDFPCFGAEAGLSSRQWWKRTVRRTVELAGRNYDDEQFDRYFRRVYQHYGSPRGYEALPDASAFLSWTQRETPGLLMGVTSNTPTRTVETVLPLVGLHDLFRWFVCSQDVGVEKPGRGIFDASLAQARFWLPDIQPHQILHLGDSPTADYCGARAAGFQALLLDRSADPRVTQYQDWLEGPDYPGKSPEDIKQGTVPDLLAVRDLLAGEVGRLSQLL